MLMLAPPDAAFAQAATATILGTVKDSSGGVVPGVTITVTNLGTNFQRTEVSNTDGQYQIRFLPLGEYRVEAVLNGFQTFLQTGVVLEVNRQARVDPLMAIGAVSETVQVQSDAPLVETMNVALGRIVNNQEILNLPIVNRNVYTLLSLTAGVDSSRESNDFGVPGQVTLVNGSSNAGGGAVNYFLDGGNNTSALRNTGNVVPNPDAVQEFRVVTNSYGAEYGRYAGGIVDVVTKSGTNQLHGSAFDYIRNDALNSSRWTPDSTPDQRLKDPLKRNQFGATVGGPIRLNRTFYFASYSGLREERAVYANTAVVPTALERAGSFSASARAPRDPLTGQLFAGGIIPADRLDPAALRLLKEWVPAANLPNNFYETTQTRPLDTDEFQLKIDHALSKAHQLTASYFFNTGKDVEPLRGDLPYTKREFSWRQHNINAGDTWTVSGTMVNQLKFTYVRNYGSRNNTPSLSLGDLGSSFVIQGPPALPNINVSGYFLLGTAIAGPSAGSDFYQVRDVVTLTRGNHSLKVGAELSREDIIHDTTLNNYGQFTFDGTKTGNALADFMLGIPSGNVTQDAPTTKKDNGMYVAGFVQDDFRIHTRLTLNVGIRYDLQYPFTDPLNQKLTFIPGARSTKVPSAPAGLLFAGEQNVPRGIVNTDYNNIGPRIGLAWDPKGDGKTALRAAIGKFYGSISANEWNVSGDAQPFSLSGRFTNIKTLSDPYGNMPGGSPFPYTFDPASPRFVNPVVVRGPDRDFVWPSSYQANVSLQRELATGLSVTAAYVGARGRGLRLDHDVNYPVFVAGATTGNVNTRRPYQPYGALLLTQSIGTNQYDGAQFTVEKRARSVSVKAYYTIGKSVEDWDLQSNTTGNVQNHTNPTADRGRTGADRRHNSVISAIWKIDYFKNSRALVRRVLNDWTVSAITTLRSGEPFTVTAGVDVNLDGNNNDRADLIGNPSVSNPSRTQWFDTSAFARPAAGVDGTAGRNMLEGPGYHNIDLGLYRDFRMGQRYTMQFRTEITNVFNLVNYSNPGANLNSVATFGIIRSASDMRQVQLGIRLGF